MNLTRYSMPAFGTWQFSTFAAADTFALYQNMYWGSILSRSQKLWEEVLIPNLPENTCEFEPPIPQL